MKKIETHWVDYADQLHLVLDSATFDEIQPSFGFEICWNTPRKWWKPYFVFHLWNVHIQIGWLID